MATDCHEPEAVRMGGPGARQARAARAICELALDTNGWR